jgi:hypothetical protein
VFLENPAFKKHTPKCSSTPRATNYACDDVKEKLRKATEDQLACRLWKSVFMKKSLEVGTRPMSGKVNFSFKSLQVIYYAFSFVFYRR